MTPEQAAAALGNLGKDLERGAEQGANRALKLLREAAIRRSEGPLSTAELRRLGHPYARRHGRPRRDPNTVNQQSEDFRNAWETEGPDEQGGILAGSVFNTDPKAELLKDGTDAMFARAPHEAALRDVEDEIGRVYVSAISRALGV